MTWRWLDDLIVPALATLLESLWLAVLVAAVSGWPPALALAFVLVTVGSGTAIAVGLRRRPVTAAAGPPPASYLPLLPVGVITAVVVILAWPIPFAMVGMAIVAVALLVTIPVWLGLRIGRDPLVPADVPPRAARAFGASFVVMLVAQASGRAVPQAGVAMAAVLLVAVVTVACARLAAGGAAHERRRTRYLWLLGVLGAGALIVGAGAALGGVLPSQAVLAPVHVVSVGFGHLMDAIGWVLGTVGGWFVRGFSTLLGYFSPDLESQIKELESKTPPQRPSGAHVPKPVLAIGQVFLIALAAALIVLIARASRRHRTHHAGEVVEERESVWSTSEKLHAGVDRVRRAVRRVARLRAAKPRHAPEALRWEYRRLEHRLDGMGHARPAGTTARGFLLSLGDADLTTARELSGLYELVRYSAHEVGWDEVERFRGAAARFVAAVRTAPPVLPD